MRCDQCEGLSISRLIELAERELSSHEFPQRAFYQHHASFAKLIKSASDECDLCQLIYQGFKEILIREPWKGKTREDVVLEVESEGRSSDLKVAINAAHLYSHEGLEQVRLFDVIMIQAGDIQTMLEPDDPGFYDAIPPLELILFKSEEKQQRIGSYQVGRLDLDSDLASPGNYNIARTWLNDCIELHEKCPSTISSKLPTRVIDVGTVEDHQDLRLYVTNEAEGSYAALSHCWGGQVSPLLTKENLASFQSTLPFSSLPANFRDAISVVKRLEIRYLWIDSLCIMQDSKEDWEIESKKMGSIYRNAQVTIAASTAHRSTDGFLKHMQRAKGADAGVPLRLLMEPHVSSAVKVKLPDDDDGSLYDLFNNSPLNTRGWTLQETILSPRMIHYGTRQIHWQCLDGFKSADGVPPGTRTPQDQLYKHFDEILHPPRPNDRKSFLDQGEYYKLVEEYSHRNLTCASDKLPAFSGLAELMHSAFGGEYLAGIWSEDFRKGLLWRGEMASCKHVRPYRAPSWSWAVTDDMVNFWAVGVGGRLASGAYDAQLISYKHVLKSQNQYGQVDSAQLTVKGLTKRFVRSSQTIGISFPDYSIGFVHFDEAEEGTTDNSKSSVFKANTDGEDHLLSIINGDGFEQKEWDIDYDLFSNREYIALLIQASQESEGDIEWSRGFGLVLEKVENTDDAYARVGYLDLLPTSPTNFEKWVKTWESRTMTLI